MTTRIATILGARPQIVKAAVVSSALADALPGGADDEVIIHTGQHYDDCMSGSFFRDLGLRPPAHDLGVGSGGHGRQTARMLEAVEAVLEAERPGLVLVYGDTNSTLAGALAAAKLNIPVAHVEAGLRSFNRAMPEEINRVLTDHMSELLFCPTPGAVAQLTREGMNGGGPVVRMVGDVMYDAALRFRDRAQDVDIPLEPPFALATLHRAENVDDPAALGRSMAALGAAAKAGPPVLLVLHPRTRARLQAQGMAPADFGVTAIDPVGYLQMLALLKRCALVLTDSGGLQKEAFFFRRPCLVLREQTEWTELVDHGWATLTGTDPERVRAALAALDGKPPPDVPELYGAGDAARRIAETLATFLKERAS